MVHRVDITKEGSGLPHIHFKDGTSINIDGTVHDKHKGMPNLDNATKKWLEKNGWKGF